MLRTSPGCPVPADEGETMTTSRSVPSLVGSFLMLMLLSSPSAAKTDLERFQAKVGKSAVEAAGFPERPKGLCVCTDTLSGVVGKVGAITMSTFGSPLRIDVRCAVPSFTAGGDQAGFASCPNFVPLR
jgi:hypothetical protein